MIPGDILLTRDGAIATVTLFNPERLNALNAAMWQRLVNIFAQPDADELRASFGILNSADYAEGYAAFRAKRTPRFSGA